MENKESNLGQIFKNIFTFPIKILGKLLHLGIWLILLVILIFFLVNKFGMEKINDWFSWSKTVSSEFISPDKALFNDRGRINIALLGFGGEGHDGGELADSIQIFSLSTKTNDAVVFAIPRDIWIPSLNEKINKAAVIGQENNQGDAVIKRSISDVTNLPIHYIVKIDFDGFTNLIDYFGGIEIEVARGFVDKQYPIKGKENDQIEANRYETLTFTPGRQIMDGKTALKFVRSRHAEGQEGSDLARSQRQQLVLKAVKDKLLNSQTLLNIDKLKELWGIGNKYVKTDVDISKIGAWLRMAMIHREAQLKMIEIPAYIDSEQSDITLDEALIYHPGISNMYKGEWVFVPKNSSFESIHQYMECKIYGVCI